MNAFARCDAPDAALKAESILQRLLADFTEGRSSIYPDTSECNILFSTAIGFGSVQKFSHHSSSFFQHR